MGLTINNDNSFILNFLDFGGGLNTRDLDTIIRDNELSDVANFNFDKRGALKVRLGFTKFSNTALSTVSSIIADSYSETNYDDYFSESNESNTSECGQSFTGDGGVLNNCKFYIKKTGSPTGNAYAKIYAHSGTFGISSIPKRAAILSVKPSNIASPTSISPHIANGLTQLVFAKPANISRKIPPPPFMRRPLALHSAT